MGGNYQTKTRLSDMKTSNYGAALSGQGGFQDVGRLTVQDFQWPASVAFGAAVQATPAVLLVADVKRIGWKSVMDAFRMRYESQGMGGDVSFALPQQWKDQTVIQIGGAWKMDDALTLRAGYNRASQPIPEQYVNPLFPATIKQHITLGGGYAFDKASSLNASLVIAPNVSVTNGDGVTVTHKQTNMQLMYSRAF